MNKKSLYYKGMVFGIIILFFGTNILPSVNSKDTCAYYTMPTNTFNIIIVDDEGDGDYISIQDAIDNASSGDTIKVYSGTYEKTSIRKKIILEGIPIEYKNGNDTGKPIIEEQSKGRLIYLCDANDCIIQGFDLIGGVEGILLVDSSRNKISENNISHCYIGIKIHRMLNQSSNNLIENNNIIDSCIGIHLEYSSNNILKKNLVANSFSWGISIDASNQNEVYENIIFNNGKLCYPIAEAGIIICFSSNNKIEKNHFEFNTYGLFISASPFTIVKYNNFIDHKGKHAIFSGIISYTTIWRRNYWDRPRILPKSIYKVTGDLSQEKIIPSFKFDWRPALKPYELI